MEIRYSVKMQQTVTEADIQFLSANILLKTQQLCNEYSIIGEGFVESFERVCNEIGGSFSRAIQDAIGVREKLEAQIKAASERAHGLVDILWESHNAIDHVRISDIYPRRLFVHFSHCVHVVGGGKCYHELRVITS